MSHGYTRVIHINYKQKNPPFFSVAKSKMADLNSVENGGFFCVEKIIIIKKQV